MNSDKILGKVIEKPNTPESEIPESEDKNSSIESVEAVTAMKTLKAGFGFSERHRQAKNRQFQRRFEKIKKDPKIRQARQELHDEFLEAHPAFKAMTNNELQEEMARHAAEEEKVRKQKLRAHIETFSDGVIAVIITIMLLEIPIPKNAENYGAFLSAVGVFFISFLLIANFWFNHHKIFAVTEEITEGTIVQDFVFMGLLSLLPLLTKWIIARPNWFSSLNYGIVILLILSQQEILSHSITRDRLRKMPISFKFWKKMWLARFLFTLVINAAITVIAVLFPSFGHWLFVIVPVFSFLSQSLIQ